LLFETCLFGDLGSNGVGNFKGSEYFNYIESFVLVNIEKVLERYNRFITDNIVGNNIEFLDYKL
jgi:hypothetical protein